MPELNVRILSAETVANVDAGVYSAPRAVANYVVVAPEVKREARSPMAKVDAPAPSDAKPAEPVAGPEVSKPAAAVPSAPAKPAEPAAADTEGLRPALGFMPEYNEAAGGVMVASVREGGSAEQAGIEAGDVIVVVNGTKVSDVTSYQEVLEQQKIGKTIPVRVRRDGAEVELQVKVGSRAARR